VTLVMRRAGAVVLRGVAITREGDAMDLGRSLLKPLMDRFFVLLPFPLIWPFMFDAKGVVGAAAGATGEVAGDAMLFASCVFGVRLCCVPSEGAKDAGSERRGDGCGT